MTWVYAGKLILSFIIGVICRDLWTAGEKHWFPISLLAIWVLT